LVSETNGSHPGFAPARPLDQISVRDILRALRTGQGSDLPTAADATRPVVQAEFAAVMAAEESRSARCTLADLIHRLPNQDRVQA
jgi:DNA-binding IscR family transcriptional regulator